MYSIWLQKGHKETHWFLSDPNLGECRPGCKRCHGPSASLGHIWKGKRKRQIWNKVAVQIQCQVKWLGKIWWWNSFIQMVLFCIPVGLERVLVSHSHGTSILLQKWFCLVFLLVWKESFSHSHRRSILLSCYMSHQPYSWPRLTFVSTNCLH